MSFGLVAQDKLRTCNEQPNHWILLRLPCADGQPPGMPRRLGGRSSLPIGAADMEASHRLNRCDAHASHYTALGDRSGQSIKRSPLSAHRCAHERVAYHESYTGKIHTTHTRCSMPSPENRKCQFMKCTTRFRGSIFRLVRHSMLVPARTSHKVKTGNERCIGGLSWCKERRLSHPEKHY